MIRQCDTKVLHVLQTGLSGIVPVEEIRLGEETGDRKPGIIVRNTGFTITDSSIGGYGGETYEAREELFDTDGKKTEFSLGTIPLRPLSAVECPPGTPRTEPDDFIVDCEKSIISFRIPPEKGKKSLKVQYRIARYLAEVITLGIDLDYIITIIAEEHEKRDQLMLELVKTLFDRRNFINADELTEVRLVRGYLEPEITPGTVQPAILECQIESVITIEIGLPTIKRIDISQK